MKDDVQDFPQGFAGKMHFLPRNFANITETKREIHVICPLEKCVCQSPKYPLLFMFHRIIIALLAQQKILYYTSKYRLFF